VHSQTPYAGAHGAPACLMAELKSHVLASGGEFPVPPDRFDAAVLSLLDDQPELGDLVGLSSSDAVVWIATKDVPAKWAHGGEESVELLANPIRLRGYKSEWEAWLDDLPTAVRIAQREAADAASDDTSVHALPPATESVLRTHVHTCAKYSTLATVRAFFHSVRTALSVTPFVSMGAIALFSRSLIISYLALYALVAMILTLLGTMRILGLPLGITSALALSLVIGISVDYIIHLAHAYKHSLLPERFFKSRATVFARASSIASAAITTLVALAPMLFAQLLPLREFGQIFFLVTIVSLLFSLAFLVALMLVGPQRTRGLRTAVRPPEDDEAAPPAITQPHSAGRGWAVQLVDSGVEASGAHGERDDRVEDELL